MCWSVEINGDWMVSGSLKTIIKFAEACYSAKEDDDTVMVYLWDGDDVIAEFEISDFIEEIEYYRDHQVSEYLTEEEYMTELASNAHYRYN